MWCGTQPIGGMFVVLRGHGVPHRLHPGTPTREVSLRRNSPSKKCHDLTSLMKADPQHLIPLHNICRLYTHLHSKFVNTFP